MEGKRATGDEGELEGVEVGDGGSQKDRWKEGDGGMKGGRRWEGGDLGEGESGVGGWMEGGGVGGEGKVV
jgi:hypothetical protein